MADPKLRLVALTVLGGALHGRRHNPDEVVTEILVGSDPDCHLVVDLPGVSPIHARIWADLDQSVVYETRAPRGLYVNTDRVEGQAPVGEGDVLWLGPPQEADSVCVQLHFEPWVEQLPAAGPASWDEPTEPAPPAPAAAPSADAASPISTPAEAAPFETAPAEVTIGPESPAQAPSEGALPESDPFFVGGLEEPSLVPSPSETRAEPVSAPQGRSPRPARGRVAPPPRGSRRRDDRGRRLGYCRAGSPGRRAPAGGVRAR